MKRLVFWITGAVCLFSACGLSGQTAPASTSSTPSAEQTFGGPGRAWLQHVRIAAWSLTPQNADTIVSQAEADGVYGIEVDNDIPGRYESLIHPEEKLEAIRRAAAAAHAHHNKAYVYIAGTECITANGDGPHTVAKEHPDWLQRKIDGQPAVFGNKAAFWIRKGEEDVWVSPYAPDWRKLYMQRIRQIAATGIDGIYIDIPYWMTHFTGWEDSWASFDDATVAAFRRETGLDARHDVHLGDFSDPAFRKWVDFRIRTITDFLIEIRANATQVNPNISIIPEIFPGIEESAPRVGSDVYQLYAHVDAIAHEYEFGEGEDHTAASRTPFDWMMYQAGIRSFRAFAGDRSTWILNYSWDGAPHVQPHDAMLNLAMSELMAGANFWDAKGHVMSGSNDPPTRREIFHWIAAHDHTFFDTRTPLGNVGVYFSDTTRNYGPKDFVAAYRGVILYLLENHIQFQIVTPRTLSSFHGPTLVLPDVRFISDEESAAFHTFAQSGRLVLTGKPDEKLQDIAGAIRLPDSPERAYLDAASSHFDGERPADASSALQKAIDNHFDISIEAPRTVVGHVARVNNKTYVYFANFTGLQAGVNATPTPQTEVSVLVPSSLGTKMHVLPFMGSESEITGRKQGDDVRFTLPAVQRGTVVWLER
ncbi:hypothetical protein [Paracidobacterium acidisoli]|uniref:hypothetical protein n=1 Tax=Paracidobacterium acidisoli TaxID=2303751 RepID=UPI0018F20FD0|nr:hypothetical protein [Paracidobacterium acidisoli]MBT9330103.1 hypothetical protein [Paracidobacterium acidisoli]